MLFAQAGRPRDALAVYFARVVAAPQERVPLRARAILLSLIAWQFDAAGENRLACRSLDLALSFPPGPLAESGPGSAAALAAQRQTYQAKRD